MKTKTLLLALCGAILSQLSVFGAPTTLVGEVGTWCVVDAAQVVSLTPVNDDGALHWVPNADYIPSKPNPRGGHFRSIDESLKQFGARYAKPRATIVTLRVDPGSLAPAMHTPQMRDRLPAVQTATGDYEVLVLLPIERVRALLGLN